MKRIKILGLLVLLLIVTSCARDDLGDNRNDENNIISENIRLEIGFSPQARGATDTDFNTVYEEGDEIRLSLSTRVSTDFDFRSTWVDGDEIGIFAVRRMPGSSGLLQAQDNYIHNVRLTYVETTPGNSHTGFWSLDDGQELYFPRDGVLDFYAYYPYDESFDTPTNILFSVYEQQNATVGINGTQRSGCDLSDLLTVESDNYGNGFSKDETVSLYFSHTLAMVQLSIEDPMKDLDLSKEISVVLKGMKTGVMLDMRSAPAPIVSIVREISDITMYRVEQPGTTEYTERFTFRALVPPQRIDAGESIFHITNGDLLIVGSNLSAAVDLSGGEVKRFLEKVSKSPKIPESASNSYMATPGAETI